MITDVKQYLLLRDTYPSIAEKLRSLWGSKEFYDFMEDLQQERTRPLRAGFPGDILMALSDLSSMHADQYPKLAPKRDDFWGAAL
jgi:hypothetical protein